ncbi:deoxyadenosine/deoxycytidine kinase [Trinickia symbiotica]|uniref:Deoxynucleoside kinase n=1 Tax=Trinickia symbiotica TaxID=863227 RepID=A0A2N7WY70_9BURK|nr:deoxynucleoside kinase [Trinickia symbiotica]PMS34453.1 deoxynucleoside kinase [Trinickia symbiotica]PPK43218.1 deoxyadenosine/deoxycytidine kinase [Trinickia symbiotica]
MTSPALTVTPPVRHAPYRYLAIEGPIGVGKTSLAQRLAERWSMRTLLERAADNPFLDRFYADMARYALPAQLHFALQRVEQAREAGEALASGAPLVADFIAQKNDVFARLTLPDDERRLYRSLAAHLPAGAPAPDFVVHLQASPHTLLSRIQKRARAAEGLITETYLRKLCEAYDQFFYHYDASPVLTINTEHLNPLESQADFALVVEQIETMRGRKASFVKAQ